MLANKNIDYINYFQLHAVTTDSCEEDVKKKKREK